LSLDFSVEVILALASLEGMNVSDSSSGISVLSQMRILFLVLCFKRQINDPDMIDCSVIEGEKGAEVIQ
jgi:hypothetical protein